MPSDYRVQDGCHNCRHRIEHEYEPNEVTLICGLEAPKHLWTPEKGTSWWRTAEITYRCNHIKVDEEKFWAFAKPRLVVDAGVCGKHEAYNLERAEVVDAS